MGLFQEAEAIFRNNISHLTGRPRPMITKGEALARAIEHRFDDIMRRLDRIERALSNSSYSTHDE